MYDVIVVGARVAGASTALRFARAGYSVLLLDRARFPSDTLSTHYIHQPGVARLARWGVLDAVRASGCPPLERSVYEVGDVRLDGCSAPSDGYRTAYAPRRQVLDQILVDAAVAAGAEFRDNCSVSGPLFEGDRVAGVLCRTAGGTRTRERARLVVGADGMRSAFARGVGAEFTVHDPLQTCIYYTYWQGLRADFELYERPGRWIGAIPTNDGATLIAAYFPQAEFRRVRGDALSHYLENIRTTAPDLYGRAVAGERVERLRGTGDQQNFFRRASGPGWALVGDAAHHKDSITARGISDAFLQTDLLADCVGEGLHDPARLDEALRRYADRHQEELFEGYRNTLFVSRLEVTPERLAMLRAVRTSASLTSRYFAAAAGGMSTDELYDDELLDLLAAA
ncbi:NAD(P)/FAD-dependent oxidoreductase [Streptomyces pini]|uniref:Dehydrogenase (Flavoprotein) n=1 Tax=Streptomyces pini TaxID=1520580 RepID=A0A1I4L0G4_9ACTN|nr:NAD(P)/FAD-dependent oxidoreductase [Streptomyces pini]SFL84510.1 Dehydrogenase (flavoprotein) [Streptomyces pini]